MPRYLIRYEQDSSVRRAYSALIEAESEDVAKTGKFKCLYLEQVGETVMHEDPPCKIEIIEERGDDDDRWCPAD